MMRLREKRAALVRVVCGTRARPPAREVMVGMFFENEQW